LIYDTFKDEPGLKFIKEILSPNGQPNKNKTISYLYQHAERQMMETLMQVAKEHRVLLLCHDAFYTKTPAPLLEMRSALRAFGEFGKIKELGHNAWSFNNTALHIEHIREEEGRAAEHYRSQGFPALTDEQIDRKIDWKLNRHRAVMNENYVNENGRDFDNGFRKNFAEYDPELDPFIKD
jgi:hypothetical protein